METHIQRLVMVKLSCTFCGASEPLRALTTPFDSQIGLFACQQCLVPAVSTQIRSALRNAQPYALYPIDDHSTLLTIKRSDGTLEQWTHIDFATWGAHFDNAPAAPVAISNNEIIIMMVSTTTPPLFRHHALKDVMALNPDWNPCVRIDCLLHATHTSVWVKAAEMIGAGHERIAL